ncbi:hypothetical protein [Arenimonas sp.]|uniref:hypothetical protein n=1 Tax=Arenimonas sp. TaxID=1872635 RepID=UPI0039E27D5B
MNLSSRQRIGIFVLLALVMMATRINHFSNLPDASWALFFLGGFYLRGSGRWAFPALMLLAVAIDAYVISASGLSFWNHYCVSIAYWFLVPAHLAMWFGGDLLRRRYQGLSLTSAGWLLATAVLAIGLCYLISNGSFYWLSDSVASRSFAGWTKNLGDWVLPYYYTSGMYLGLATAVHVGVALVARHTRRSAVTAQQPATR